jgi:hypothetical protein
MKRPGEHRPGTPGLLWMCKLVNSHITRRAVRGRKRPSIDGRKQSLTPEQDANPKYQVRSSYFVKLRNPRKVLKVIYNSRFPTKLDFKSRYFYRRVYYYILPILWNLCWYHHDQQMVKDTEVVLYHYLNTCNVRRQVYRRINRSWIHFRNKPNEVESTSNELKD